MKESQTLEFKESWRDEYIKYVSGFANSHGGILYIGVNDKGEIVGAKDADRLLEDIPNKISAATGIVADINLLTEAGTEYVSISIAPSALPISYKGKFYYRSGSTLQELSGVAMQEFIMKKMGISWDSQIVDGATLEDINIEAIEYFIESGVANGRLKPAIRNDSLLKILGELQLIEDNGKLTMAAIMLFGNNPQKYCLNARFKIGWFGDGAVELRSQDLIGGDLIRMADRVMEVLDSKYLVRPIQFEGMQRVERLEIPEIGLREILYNSIAHKCYEGPDIQMKIYSDRINLWNFGTLPAGYTFDTMFKEHKSMPRNKLIANAFYYAGFVEAWGRGFEVIEASFKKENLEVPLFREEFQGVTVEIKRERFLRMRKKNSDNDYEKVLVDDTDDTNDDTLKLTERQKVILSMLSRNDTLDESDDTNNSASFAAKLGVSTITVKRDLKVLMESGLIRRVGSRRKGYWVVVDSTR